MSTVSNDLLRQYLRPWYAAMSITIYRDIKAMAAELLERRGLPVDRAAAELNPVMPVEAKQMRANWPEGDHVE